MEQNSTHLTKVNVLMKVNPNLCLIFAQGLNGQEINENIIRDLKLQGDELEKSLRNEDKREK